MCRSPLSTSASLLRPDWFPDGRSAHHKSLRLVLSYISLSWLKSNTTPTERALRILRRTAQFLRKAGPRLQGFCYYLACAGDSKDRALGISCDLFGHTSHQCTLEAAA